MVWLPRWGCDGMITSAQKLLMARAGAVPVDRSWDIAYASYSGVSFDVSAQETSDAGVSFKPDGTKMYVVGRGSDAVSEYSLSTSWDVSTASYSQQFSVAAQENSPYNLFFKPDGTKMYVVGSTGDDVNEYDLSTAWDVSTSSFVQSFSVSAQETIPACVFFKPDGTKMYVAGLLNDVVSEYDLSVAWDVSTATHNQDFSVASQEGNANGLSFKPDGTKMYVSGKAKDNVNEYDLSTAWDVSTASFTQSFSLSDTLSYSVGLFFRDDGLKFFVMFPGPRTVYAYDIG